MASLAYGLLFAPDVLWTPLTESQKSNLANWLFQINGLYVAESNWLFFRVLVNAALKQCGMRYDSARLESDLAQIDGFYLGDGWYSDGVSTPRIPHNGQKDYYISFAFHFYSLVYAAAMKEEDPARAETFRSRATLFAHQFIHWFSDNGEAVPYGRSMTYRFAQVAFWSMCPVAGVTPFDISVIKGIIVRNLAYWLSDDRIFDNGHVLTVGYRYNQQIMSECYNAPGSPYWSMKAFAFLALPESHPFWSCPAAPLPALQTITTQEKAELMVGRYPNSVTLYPAGTLNTYPDETIHKYLKFAYSSKFGFSMPRSTLRYFSAAPDSTLVFELEDRILIRRFNRGFDLTGDRVVIRWSPGVGIEVETEIIPTASGHVRVHHIRSGIDCIAYDSAFAVDCTGEFETCTEPNTATVKNAHSYCAITSEDGIAQVKETAPNTNLISPKTLIPAIQYEIKRGETTVTCEVKEVE